MDKEKEEEFTVNGFLFGSKEDVEVAKQELEADDMRAPLLITIQRTLCKLLLDTLSKRQIMSRHRESVKAFN